MIAILLPVIFMNGVIGKFFFQFGVTLSVAVMLPYFEAITLVPARCSQMLTTSREGRSRICRAADAAFSWLLLGSVALAKSIPREFVPSQDQSRLLVRVETERERGALQPVIGPAWTLDVGVIQCARASFRAN